MSTTKVPLSPVDRLDDGTNPPNLERSDPVALINPKLIADRVTAIETLVNQALRSNMAPECLEAAISHCRGIQAILATAETS